MTTLWKVHCQENEFPGIWRHWFRNQCVAFGWPPSGLYRFGGNKTGDTGWTIARNALRRVSIGDSVFVTLQGSRVGRIGTVTGLRLEDSEWNPLVPPRPGLPQGELGRRIEVRWDLTCGPDSADSVVVLPPSLRLSGAALRLTIAEVTTLTESDLRAAMSDPANWVGLNAGFKYERSLSDYIAAYAHRLEDGLIPHPDAKVRERVFKDKTRLDVLLLDRVGRPVIVECKQDAPSVDAVDQLGHYLTLLAKETGRNDVRGLLVHGGSRRVRQEVADAAEADGRIALVFHELRVDFDGSRAG